MRELKPKLAALGGLYPSKILLFVGVHNKNILIVPFSDLQLFLDVTDHFLNE